MEDALQEHAIRAASLLLVNFVDAPCSPGQHRWVDIAKCPFVSRELPIRVHIPLSHQQIKLALGKVAINKGKRYAVECQVPGGIPGIFPLVRHRHHPLIIQVPPLPIAPILALRRWRRLGRVASQPLLNYIVIELLAP